ncbi:hypothetical protein [Acinetobacter sp. YH1901141]|uniref:hypothetical protein n=1 Tax=Acinetobacter sp. YH1901141 TaxID=2601201 RepID=UPI0015D219AB|nr:hypothetical protein [Acinetobacter sp. YH1901141]
MKSVYSLEEVIAASQNSLSINDIKHYCRIGKLNPCIYFEGNLVCIREDRYQETPCKTDPVAHVEEVKWSTIFEGYIHFSQLIDYLDPKHALDSGIFYNVDKILEFITPLNTDTLKVPLAKNEYLKAFPRKIDDDIKNIRWLLEATDFEGNTFYSRDIVFHHSEVEFLLPHSQKAFQVKIDTPLFYKNEFFTLIEAACLIANINPVDINNAWDDANFSAKYPKFVEAHNFVLSIYHTSNLKRSESPLFLASELKQLLANKGILISGFNDNIEQMNLETELFELRREKIKLMEEKQKLESKVHDLENIKINLEAALKENCLPFSGDDPNFPIELSLAIFIWTEIYINKRFPQKYSHEQSVSELFTTMDFADIPLTEKLKDRLKTVTTPLRLKPKEWNTFKENLKNHGYALSKLPEGTP